jgi:hypothetical protein
MKKRLLLLGLVVAACNTPTVQPPATTNPEYIIEPVKTGLNTPWSINFASSDQLYFTSRDSSVVTVRRLNTTTGAVDTLTHSSAVRWLEHNRHFGHGVL